MQDHTAVSAKVPAAWAVMIDDYLGSLAAVGQRKTTVALRRVALRRMAALLIERAGELERLSD